jgi:dipeptidyl aminopeptidase/acylaminoacyl peptidase
MVERTLLPHRLAASLLITAFALASCGSFPPGGSASVAPPAETAAAAAPTPPATQAPVVPTEPAATAVPADTAAPATAAPTAAPTTQPAPTAQPAAFASEIMFLRQGVLTAYDTQTRAERLVADGVRDFAATPDGSRMALVRENERTTDLWLVQRDGSGLARLTSDGNERIEATPSWAPDGLTLAFAAADSSDQYTRRWPDWASWCAVSQVVALDLPSGAQRPLGAGCDPAFSPDGRRVAFAAPPSEPEPGLESLGATAANSIRLVNRQGQNGWDFATAEGAEAADVETGRLVYAPSWSPSGDRVLYQRFVGMQVETDVNVSEPSSRITAADHASYPPKPRASP